MSTLVSSRPRRLAAFVAAVALLAACTPAPISSPIPTPGPSATPAAVASPTPGGSQAPAADVYAAIRRDVETIRGLEPAADVDPVTIDEDKLRANLTSEFDKENTAADLKFSEETLILLGLLPEGTSLREITLDFQGSQVAGYYSPDRKELFVVSRTGGLGPAEKVTYAHEFTHQLQDQNFPLLSLLGESPHNSDGALAKLSLIEGDAVSVQTAWTLASLTPEEMGQLFTAALDPKALEALQRAPAYLRETALFPYTIGLAFVQSLIASGGSYGAVNDAFGKSPDSTEQIIHPEKYVAREAPVSVKLPTDLATKMGTGWTEAGQDTLGEFVFRLWLTQNGVPTATATPAVAGWGGDRLVLLRGPSGERTIGIVTAWDTEADATEFGSAASIAGKSLGSEGAMAKVGGSNDVTLAFGPHASRLLALIAPGVTLSQ